MKRVVVERFGGPEVMKVVGVVVDEIVDWIGHSPDQLQAMREGLADLKRRG